MILDTTDQYVDENGIIVPWMFERHFVDEWNQVAQKLKFRSYVNKGTAYASRRRLSEIILANADLLGGSRRSSKDLLTCRFLSQFTLACCYLRQNDHDQDLTALEAIGREYQKTMGVWQWLRPDLRAIVFLAGLYLGDPDALSTLQGDKQRRADKAKAMQRLKASWTEVERKIAYLLKDADDIKMLDPIVTKALASIEDEIEFLADKR